MSEFFALDKISALSSVPAGAQIHVIGVCGVAMAPLAVQLARAGFKVSGSDKEFYEPMAGVLRANQLELKTGYKASNIPVDSALVVIGNAVSRNNEEVMEVERRALAYSCAPALLYDLVIKSKCSVVVSGTHGKSSTTALLASTLKNLKAAPSFFVGALPLFAELGIEAQSGKFSVVEGDEYDSAFFAKIPKFCFYKPEVLIVTSVEFDHADIYPSLEAINQEFTKLINSMSAKGVVICQADFPNLDKLISAWRTSAKARIVTYGCSASFDLNLTSSIQKGPIQKVSFSSKQLGQRSYDLPMLGQHNALNSLAAYAALLELGFTPDQIEIAISKYPGIKRRQELCYVTPELTIIDDFAHHPTAVRETLNAVRAAYPDKRIWAVFEPRSNTSRRKIFQRDYVTAFKAADQVVLCNVQKREIDKGQELLDVNELSSDISASGVPSTTLPDSSSIAQHLIQKRSKNDLFLIMSNGSFGGLVEQLKVQLSCLTPDS